MPDSTNSTTDTQTNLQDNPQQNPPGAGEPQTWEAILEGLPEEAKGLYEQHTHGLKSALDAERQQRKDLAKQLQDASGQLEAGSKARTDLEALQARLEETERRADFATEASGHGVNNIRLAYLAAQEFETFDRRGNVQWDALKEAAPELFNQPQPARGNAGAGTTAPPQRGPDIDALIRAAAGRG
jgi:hypothetical protein